MIRLAKRLSTRKKIAILVFALLLILVLIFIRSFSGPAKGTIEPPKVGTERQVQTNYLTLDGQNFNLSYPDEYRKEDTGKHAVNIIESYRLTAAGSRGGLARILAVTIYDAPGGMQETSAYKSRMEDPSTYQKKIEQIDSYEVHSFENMRTPEKVAFIQKGSMVATIGFSGGITAEGVQVEYDYIAKSFSWR